MHAVASTSLLEARLAELLMSTLCPCDLGDGVEVVHDVEDAVEIEMECDVDDDAPAEAELAGDTLPFSLPDELVNTMEFRRADDLDTTIELVREVSVDDAGTQQFLRYSAPYERIEIQVDPHAFVRATIEEARSAVRTRRDSAGCR